MAIYNTAHGSRFIDIGYQGYFLGKNYLGECASIGFLLSVHELYHRGWRRMVSFPAIVIAVTLVFLSNSKTAFALAIVCPLLARLTLIGRRITHLSPAVILLSLPICYMMLSVLMNVDIMGRIAYILFHDSSLTGRTVIWSFAQYEIRQRPLLGWGYQSFWLVPESPSSAAPGWVKMMPNAHNGYYDTMLELGYVGLAFLVIFIIATLHAIGRVADRDAARARLLLSLALFMILYNYFESLWMRGFEFLWVIFVIVAAEIGRYCQPFQLGRVAYGSAARRPDTLGASSRTRAPRLGIRLSGPSRRFRWLMCATSSSKSGSSV
jgi:O-antigen ligase